ncbi:hypothetical protein G7048_18210 [Diaphorobacter sp. HDW4B]|uniref:hypothetical protein n=1 Tax=Diaphorobacter sp. HDW4B TaxID=2714925 RepID=UPI00140A7938|nr:hypothetical protein [Diaphorobacter sp. HDW4B]QIL72123.1 hypothetical protein G7048_18210 [Diaphorobacter sp. HDW4B]
MIPAICGVAEPRNSGAIAAFCALHLIQNHGALHRVHPRQVALGKASRRRMRGCIAASKRPTNRSQRLRKNQPQKQKTAEVIGGFFISEEAFQPHQKITASGAA